MKKLLNIIIVIALLTSLIGVSGCGKEATNDQSDASSDTSVEKYKEAMVLYEEDKLEEALEAFKQVEKHDNAHYNDALIKIDQLTETLFERYVNKAGEHYDAGEYEPAISSLETALSYRESRPVRELLDHYRSAEGQNNIASLSPEEKQEVIKEMQTYQGGEGALKIALDNIYTREFTILSTPIEVSGDMVFLKLWVNIINEGTGDVFVKPEYVKVYTSDNRAHTYHPEYSAHLDIPFIEILLPPNGRASGRLLLLLPLESSYRFEYDDGTNKVTKTIIPY